MSRKSKRAGLKPAPRARNYGKPTPDELRHAKALRTFERRREFRELARSIGAY